MAKNTKTVEDIDPTGTPLVVPAQGDTELNIVEDAPAAPPAEDVQEEQAPPISRAKFLRYMKRLMQEEKRKAINEMELNKRTAARRRKDKLERESRKRNWRK